MGIIYDVVIVVGWTQQEYEYENMQQLILIPIVTSDAVLIDAERRKARRDGIEATLVPLSRARFIRARVDITHSTGVRVEGSHTRRITRRQDVKTHRLER